MKYLLDTNTCIRHLNQRSAAITAHFHAINDDTEIAVCSVGSIFTYNGLLAISDGIAGQLGTLTTGEEWFKPWRTVDGHKLDPYIGFLN